jgi:hypothetical protein
MLLGNMADDDSVDALETLVLMRVVLDGDNRTVPGGEGRKDESNTAVLEEEDTVPAGTIVLVDGEDAGAVLDPPAAPPPMLLEVVPAGAALELTARVAVEEA